MARIISQKFWALMGILMILRFGSCHRIIELDIKSDVDKTPNEMIPQDEAPRDEIFKKSTDNICLTPSCVHAAAQVQRNMDANVDPCDDFYRFACGGFLKTTLIPDDKETINMAMVISQQIRGLMGYSLGKPDEPSLSKSLKLVKKLYKSCINHSEREEQGFAPLFEIFEKLGGMPVLSTEMWDGTGFNWIETIYKLRDMGFDVKYFPHFNVMTNPGDDTLQVISLSIDGVLSESISKLEMKNKILVFNDMIEIFKMMNAPHDQVENDASDLIEFIENLGDIYSSEIRRNYESMNIIDMNGNFPSISWEEYFKRSIPSGITIEDSEMIIVQNQDLIKNVIEFMERTSKRVQANYIMWETILSAMPSLNDKIYVKYMDLMKHIGSEVKKPVRKNDCIEFVADEMSISMGALFVQDHVDKNKKKDMSEIVANIRDQITNATSKLRFDRRSKKILLDKIASMTFNIAHPEELSNNSIIEEYHKDLELSEQNFFGNILNLTNFFRKKEFENLKSEEIERIWVHRMNPMIVNAVNMPFLNIVDVPAGILHLPFNSNDSPKYMMYGDAGFTIGHEINHGFGTLGSIDKDGNVIQQRSSNTQEAISKLHRCLINQYENYTVGDKGRISGYETLEENIADNGGLKMAYRAYVNWSTGREPEPQLPSLPYTPKQMFWIIYANTWCEKNSDPNYVNESDEHTPNEYRVIGTLSNMEDFSKDFKCAEGSRMNPVKKCHVW